MTTDLDRRLDDLGDTLLAEPPALPELQERARRIRRRRQAGGAAGTLLAAALVLALWTAADELQSRRVEFPPADPGRIEPVPPSEWPLGVVVPGRMGVVVVPFDSPDEPALLQSDRFYDDIMWALPDHRGGLVFQHETTPPPWPPGAVLWLRTGAALPELLIPPEAAWEPATFPRAGILPIGMATSDDGHALFVYAVDNTIMVADLDRGGATRQVAELDGSIQPDFGRYHAMTGGGVIAAVDREVEDCHTVTLLAVDDGSPIPATGDCIPQGLTALSHDGRSLGAVPWSALGDTTFRATVIDLSTGATVQEAALSVGDQFSAVGLTSGPGGWLAYIETPTHLLLMDLFDGVERARIAWGTLPISEWRGAGHLYYHHFHLGSGAALGSGSGELPCQPTAATLPAQELPAAAAATRQLLFDLASACDYEALAALAREHDTLVFISSLTATRFGELLETEDDLVRAWVADGRADLSHAGIRSREPLATLAELLSEAPVYVEQAADLPASQPEREGSVWVWPVQWVEAPPVSGTAHTDYRVGIAPDGTWRFFVAGDFTGEPPPPAHASD